MANQFTKGTRTKHDESTKDRIRAEQLSKRLEKYAKAKGKSIDKYRMEPAQVAAAKVLIERGKPALQAIEQTIKEEPKSEEEVLAILTHLITGNPGLKAQLRAILDGSPTLVQPPQSTAASDPDVSTTEQAA